MICDPSPPCLPSSRSASSPGTVMPHRTAVLMLSHVLAKPLKPSYIWHGICKHHSLNPSPSTQLLLLFFFFSFPPSALHVLVHLVNHAGQLPTGFIGLVSYSPEIFQGRFIHHQPSLDWPGLSKDAREPHTITQSEAINSQSKMLHHWICASDGMLWQAVYTGVGSGGASKQETREKLFVRQEFTKHLLCERRWR